VPKRIHTTVHLNLLSNCHIVCTPYARKNTTAIDYPYITSYILKVQCVISCLLVAPKWNHNSHFNQNLDFDVV